MKAVNNQDIHSRSVPGWLSAVLVGGIFITLFVLELRRPLRTNVEPKLRRNARNFAVAGLSAVALQVAERPVVLPLARLVQRRRWGLLGRVPLPVLIEVPLAVALLDYTLYLWHVATHKAPFLWRFHQVHHVDLDMDASTALRFHFGELTISIVSRSAQIAGIGVTPLALSVWQVALMANIIFHHSNLRLSPEVERRLSRWIVTPRMHGIHHSVIKEEANSNWSSGLTLWDRLHGTLHASHPDHQPVIGLPAFRLPGEVTLPKLIQMPFGKQRPTWRSPRSRSQTDGSPTYRIPQRPRLGSPTVLRRFRLTRSGLPKRR